jgi:hypothetical protein
MNTIEKWWLRQTASVVHVGTKYAVRKPIFSIFRILTTGDRYEYLDLNTLPPLDIVNNTVGPKGGVYGMPGAHNKIRTRTFTKLHWWSTPETITKYCVHESIQVVTEALQDAIEWKKPELVELPPVSKVENVRLELAQQKLSGKYTEKIEE